LTQVSEDRKLPRMATEDDIQLLVGDVASADLSDIQVAPL